MSKLVRHLVSAAAAVAALSTSAEAQLLGGALPQVSLPAPTANLPVGSLPVAGPVLQDLLGQPGAQQAISPTLDSVSGITDSIANSGASSLLELRRLRLNELIRANRGTIESDGNGLPVR